MIINRWDGTQLVQVQEQDLSTYATGGLYIQCNQGPNPCNHLWLWPPQTPVPPSQQVKQRILKEVPHINGA